VRAPEAPRSATIDKFDEDFTGTHPRGHHPEDANGPPANQLRRDEIATVMRAAESGVKACGRAAGVDGSVFVGLVVQANGGVSAATVTGRLAGSPLAGCVEQTLKSVRFRPNAGMSLTYPFLFKAKGGTPDCGRVDATPKNVNAAAVQQLATPLNLCVGRRKPDLTVPLRLAVDGEGVIQAIEMEPLHAGTRAGRCVERVLSCLLGSVSDALPTKWEVGLNGQPGSPANLRPLP
jgi:hypothetical protein